MEVGLLERMQGPVWLSKTVVCRRYGLVGVPAAQIDLAIDQRLIDEPPEYGPGVRRNGDAWIEEGTRGQTWPLAIELAVQRKAGRYDGAERDRIMVRLRPAHQMRRHATVSIRFAKLVGHCEHGGWRIDVRRHIDPLNGVVAALNPHIDRYIDADEQIADTAWTRRYACLRSDLTTYDSAAIVMWHWTRYYRHLPHDVATSVAAEWVADEWATHSARWTLAEANRSASRALYRASRDEGWRKLTQRERRALGLPDSAGQWHRADSLSAAGRKWASSGCGQYTLESSAGRT